MRYPTINFEENHWELQENAFKAAVGGDIDFLFNAINGLGTGEVAVAEQLILGGVAVDVPLFMTMTGGFTAQYSGVIPDPPMGPGLIFNQPVDSESPHVIRWQVGGIDLYSIGTDYLLEDFILLCVNNPAVGDLIRVNQDGLIRISPGCADPAGQGCRLMIGGGTGSGDIGLGVGGSYGKISSLMQFGLSDYPVIMGVAGAADAILTGAVDYDCVLINPQENASLLFSCWPNNAINLEINQSHCETSGAGKNDGIPNFRSLLTTRLIGGALSLWMGYRTDANLAAFCNDFAAGAGGYSFITYDAVSAYDELARLTALGIDVLGALITQSNAAPEDGDLVAGKCALWFDKTNGAAKFMITAKQADGAVKTGAVNLS